MSIPAILKNQNHDKIAAGVRRVIVEESDVSEKLDVINHLATHSRTYLLVSIIPDRFLIELLRGNELVLPLFNNFDLIVPKRQLKQGHYVVGHKLRRDRTAGDLLPAYPRLQVSPVHVVVHCGPGFLDRHIQSSKLVHAALLLLMLEAHTVTSFHHQPEAQHPKSPAFHHYRGRLPHLLADTVDKCGRLELQKAIQ